LLSIATTIQAFSEQPFFVGDAFALVHVDNAHALLDRER